ncbi:MAG: tRNA pseudouridine(38-40) synthase TruA [Ignavibacteria bacterium]|nr:tRNA pseudouridine(38-40) synthase TruA [Ignavibacteria bacterium]
MPRFRLHIEYDGTRFSGWQVQKNAKTIQGRIMEAIREVTGTASFEFYGSGRTDAGVHALGQVAHLDVDTSLQKEILRLKLNDELPPDIHVLKIDKADRSFHARHDAVARSYLYQISTRRTAFGKKYVWWIKDELDYARMEDALELFTGMKDFQSFTADDPEEKSTRVLVESMQMRRAGDLILIRIVGSHFLWKMVRQIVGILVEVGRGNVSNEEVRSFLRGESDTPAKNTAPPSGLFLEGVYYKGEKREEEMVPVLNILSHDHRHRQQGK